MPGPVTETFSKFHAGVPLCAKLAVTVWGDPMVTGQLVAELPVQGPAVH